MNISRTLASLRERGCVFVFYAAGKGGARRGDGRGEGRVGQTIYLPPRLKHEERSGDAKQTQTKTINITGVGPVTFKST